jgi:hypothetical protein
LSETPAGPVDLSPHPEMRKSENNASVIVEQRLFMNMLLFEVMMGNGNK